MARTASMVRIVFVAAAISAGSDASADAPGAMDLGDAQPRTVSVRFEVSPGDAPSRLGALYSDPVPGRLEPGDTSGQIRVTIPAAEVEAHRFPGQRLLRGSFSDFVWIFDAASGDVVSAHLRGTLLRRLDLGLFASDVETQIETELTTRGLGGFEPGRVRFGQLLFPFCRTEAVDCTLVAARRYDPHSGYVNAVGPLVGRALGAVARTFSPLGEAIFSELDRGPAARLHFADAR